jgi:hypothetical protein
MSINVFAGEDALAAPDDPLVTLDDFVEWFSMDTPSTLEAARIQTALEIASGIIRRNRRVFSPIASEAVTLDGSGTQNLFLPRNRLPVTHVQGITQLVNTDYVTVDPALYDWSEHGIVTYRSYFQRWSSRNQSVIATYSHGYATIPREVAGVCLALSKRVYDNPDGGGVIKSEALGDWNVEYIGYPFGLIANEIEQLKPYEAPQ